MARRDVLLFSLLLIATVSVVAVADREPSCVYKIFVQTGWVDSAGTDSVISAKLSDKAGMEIEIPNLQTWGGLMGPGYDYFERGNRDIFSGLGPCLPSPVCSLSLTSDGTGQYPGWFVNYVDVTTFRVDGKIEHQYFDVEQWLTIGEPTYSLSVVRNNCPFSRGDTVGRVGPVIHKTLS